MNPTICPNLGVILLLGGILIGATACAEDDRRRSADEVLHAWSDAVQRRDFDRALGLYADVFFKETSVDDWKNALMKAQNELGDLESTTILNATTTSKISLGKRATATDYECELKFSRGSARMRLIVLQAGVHDPPRISAQVIRVNEPTPGHSSPKNGRE